MAEQEVVKSYTYDPGKLNGFGMDRMRFELGDTVFAPGELTAALCDEEYQVLIAQNKRWKKAKLRCLEAILMRFSHQVDVNIDGLSYSFANRVTVWNELLAAAKRDASAAVPTACPDAIGGDGYFYTDMHCNYRKGV